MIDNIDLKNILDLKFIIDFLKPYTKRAYLVGGSVRDLILGLPLNDYDIELYDISPKNFDNIMQNLGAKGHGKNFFVYKYKNFDIALARYENKTSFGHNGFEVFVCDDEKKGAKRRDFTINSMMINLFTNEFLDFYGGYDDLKNKTLKHINDKSFKEDSLRIFRAIYFVSKFNLTLSHSTFNLIKNIDIDDLSIDRINTELYKFFKTKNLLLGFKLLQKLNLEEKIFGLNSTKHKNYNHFINTLKKANLIIKDEGLFLYLYLNFFNINKDIFFKKTKLKKSLYLKSKQDFFIDDLSDFTLCNMALKIPLNNWLGLWDDQRILRAKKLKIYDKILKFDINIQALNKEGLKGKSLGLKIAKIKEQKIKAYLRNF